MPSFLPIVAVFGSCLSSLNILLCFGLFSGAAVLLFDVSRALHSVSIMASCLEHLIKIKGNMHLFK